MSKVRRGGSAEIWTMSKVYLLGAALSPWCRNTDSCLLTVLRKGPKKIVVFDHLGVGGQPKPRPYCKKKFFEIGSNLVKIWLKFVCIKTCVKKLH